MNNKKISIGLVGVANHGTTILNAILAAGNFKLETCYDTDLAASEQVRKQTGWQITTEVSSIILGVAFLILCAGTIVTMKKKGKKAF